MVEHQSANDLLPWALAMIAWQSGDEYDRRVLMSHDGDLLEAAACVRDSLSARHKPVAPSEWEQYADHLRNCRHKSGDPLLNLHQCTCGLREIYERHGGLRK